MLRFTVCFAVLAAMFASTAEVEAQRRAPLRNLFKNVGLGWGTGNHYQTPGYDTSYYNPYGGSQYSSQDNWQYQNQGQHFSDGQIISNGQMNNGQIITDGQIIQTPTDGQIYQNAIPTQPTQPTPQSEPATQKDNSASRMLQQQRSTIQTSQPIQNQYNQQRSIQHPGTTSSIGDQTQLQINQHLKPYHATSGNNPIQINQGGQFQIAPGQTPTSNTGWNGQQQIQTNQNYIPRK